MNTHDYTRREWGHDYTFEPIDGGLRGTMMGWGAGICPGDYIVIPNKGGTTRYQFEAIKYMHDPPDMWEADVVFAPRDSNIKT